jgi:hypothetical protein
MIKQFDLTSSKLKKHGCVRINYKTIKEFFNKEFTKFLENYIVIHKTKYNTKKYEKEARWMSGKRSHGFG